MPLPEPQQNKISISEGLAVWLAEEKTSIAFSSYDSGFLFLLGEKEGTASLAFRKYGRTMGLCYYNKTLYVASNDRIFELENIGSEGEEHDAVFLPRRHTFIGNCDCHEIYAGGDTIFFANTAYSCVAALHKTHSFSVCWKPDFISKIVPEDRCHLNGISWGNELLVSYVAKSDTFHGWRSNRGNGGVVVGSGVQISNLSMPHSPRWYGDKIAYLDSGRGFLCVGEQKIFLPGFLRGLCFHKHYAIVTLSLPRHGVFDGLELQENLKERGGNPVCGLFIINLKTEAIEHWLKIEGPARELFDCCLLPNIKCPTALAPGDPAMLNRTTFAV